MEDKFEIAFRLGALIAAHPGKFTAWTAGRMLREHKVARSEQQVVNIITALSYAVPELAEDEDRRLHLVKTGGIDESDGVSAKASTQDLAGIKRN